MERSPRPWPPVIAAAGAGVLLVSLWLHWYELHIPGALLDRAEQFSGQLGILGPYVNRAAELLRTLGPLHADAWQVFGQIDVALAVAGVLGGVLALLRLTGRAAGTGAIVGLCGLIAVSLAGYRAISPPGPSGLLHPQIGAYLALLAGVGMILGGLLDGDVPVLAAPVDEPWQSAPAAGVMASNPALARASVAPPGTRTV